MFTELLGKDFVATYLYFENLVDSKIDYYEESIRELTELVDDEKINISDKIVRKCVTENLVYLRRLTKQYPLHLASSVETVFYNWSEPKTPKNIARITNILTDKEFAEVLNKFGYFKITPELNNKYSKSFKSSHGYVVASHEVSKAVVGILMFLFNGDYEYKYQIKRSDIREFFAYLDKLPV